MPNPFHTGLFAGVVALGLTAPAAAVPLLNEAVLDGIFSQPSFGDTLIDVRLLPTRTIVSEELSTIDNVLFDFEDANKLFALGTTGPVLDFFLVDEIKSPIPGSIIRGIAEVTVFFPSISNVRQRFCR